MKKMISALLAASAIAAVAAPAMAQPYGGGYGGGRGGGYGQGHSAYNRDLRDTYNRIERRIEQGARNGSLSRREVYSLTSQLRDLRRLDRQYRYSDGRLTRWEHDQLERRAWNLMQQVRRDRHDWDRRGGAYSWRDDD